MSTTEQNLKEAFAGESQANRRYLAFAKKAEQEGYTQVAKLFRAAAEAETIHALAHLRTMKGVGSTAENLKAAIAGETFEFTKMYPAMIEAARAEGHQLAERFFTWANEVEKVHAELYQKALATLESPEAADYHVCTACGHTVAGEPPDTCPVCGAKKSAYRKVD
ncbi:MAG: rubrerythrin family protein [Desulfobacteraceae bacterium]|nr:rubrerythrin family protein [Desulfobacteraceae bacterium]